MRRPTKHFLPRPLKTRKNIPQTRKKKTHTNLPRQKKPADEVDVLRVAMSHAVDGPFKKKNKGIHMSMARCRRFGV